MVSFLYEVRDFNKVASQMCPLPFRIDSMQVADIPYVMNIERRVFPMAWTSGIYQRELTANPWSHYLVLRSFGQGLPPLLAYGGIWQMDHSAHIPTIATHPDLVRRKLGSFMLVHLLLIAEQLGCLEATLEVRVSNKAAQALYHLHQFEAVGRRRRYYSDNREDALIMSRALPNKPDLEEELTMIEDQMREIWLPEVS